jgi:glycosyltransferase involved in cell wall biosynthesis
VKNLYALVSIFNSLNGHLLTIVGSGKEGESLKKIANKNIKFIDSIKNTDIYKIFDINDFLILPSLIEPWGLVVDEALYFNTPVIISKNCGARDLIQSDVNGYVVDPLDTKGIEKIIKRINTSKYKSLKKGFKSGDINKKDKLQVQSYSNAL